MLCSRPSTNHTLSIEIEELTIVHVPMILPDWLPPNFTFPPSFIVRVRNIKFSPIVCLGQPLSRYHDFCFSFALRHISFSSSESYSSSAFEVTVAINPTTTFASSSTSSLSDSDSLSNSSSVTIKLCLIYLELV